MGIIQVFSSPGTVEMNPVCREVCGEIKRRKSKVILESYIVLLLVTTTVIEGLSLTRHSVTAHFLHTLATPHPLLSGTPRGSQA